MYSTVLAVSTYSTVLAVSTYSTVLAVSTYSTVLAVSKFPAFQYLSASSIEPLYNFTKDRRTGVSCCLTILDMYAVY